MSDQLPEVSFDALQKSLIDIAESLGMETASALVEHFGGGRVWIPQQWREDHPLNIIGEDRARQLCEHFGPSGLDVPKSLIAHEARFGVIRQLEKEGVSRLEIARRLGLTDRTIRRDLRRSGASRVTSRRATRFIDPRQIDLEDLLK